MDNNNKIKQTIKCNLKENEIMKLNYICDKKELNKETITFEMSYFINDQKYEQLYEIVPYQLPKGEELSKLIIYDNILKKQSKEYEENNLNDALKYQIFYKNTSLYAELELSKKIEEKMKLKIIGDKENNVIEIKKNKCSPKKECKREEKEKEEEEDDDCGFGDIFGGGGGGGYHYKEDEEEEEGIMIGCKLDSYSGGEKFKFEKKEENKNKKNNEKKTILNDKDYIMTIINTQDFIEGYWEENEKTKNIKIKYDKEFNLLKNKNFSDNVSITVLIIFFINKEYPELLDELLMIIKKAKEFIKKATNISYEDIIKDININ